MLAKKLTKTVSLVIALAMVLTAMPIGVFAAPGDGVTITDNILTDGKFVANITGTAKGCQWSVADSRDGEYTDIEGAAEEAIDVTDYARKWLKVTVTFEDNSTETATRQVEYYDALQNGGFEAPVVGSRTYPASWGVTYQFRNGTAGLYWQTTGLGTGEHENADIEIVRPSLSASDAMSYYKTSTTASDASEQFAELNAETWGALYQDVLTHPGDELSWSLAHRGRYQEDTMQVVIVDAAAVADDFNPANSLVSADNGAQATITTGNTAWSYVNGTYTVPRGQYVTRFYFVSVSGNGGTQANLIDDVVFSKTPGEPIVETYEYTINYYVDGVLDDSESNSASEGAIVNASLTHNYEEYDAAPNNLYSLTVSATEVNVLNIYYTTPVEPAKYNVTYEYTNAKPADAAEASSFNQTGVEANTSVTVATAPTSETHNFSGWTVKSGTASTTEAFPLVDNVVFQGTWTVKPVIPVEPTTYSIIYNANGGNQDTCPATQSNLSNGSHDLDNTTTPTRTADENNTYEFAGWGLTAAAQTAVTAVTINNEDVTVYAIWTATPKQPITPPTTSYTVTLRLHTMDLDRNVYTLAASVEKTLTEAELDAFVASALNSYTFTPAVTFFDRTNVAYTLAKPAYVGLKVNAKEYGLEHKADALGLTKDGLLEELKANNNTAVLDYYFAQIVHYSVNYGAGANDTYKNVTNVSQIFTTNQTALGVTIPKTLTDASGAQTFTKWQLNGADYTVAGETKDEVKVNGFSQANAAKSAIKTDDGIDEVWFDFTSQWAAKTYTLTIHYVYSTGGTAAPDFMGQVAFDTDFAVASPIISNYTPDQGIVVGHMMKADLEFTVTYTAIPTYSINYAWANDSVAAPTTVTLPANRSDITDLNTFTPAAVPTTTETGYTITGWYTDAEHTTEYVPGAVLTDDATLYALCTYTRPYTPPTTTAYTLTVDWVNEDGEILRTTERSTVVRGRTYTTTQHEFEGYTFKAMADGSDAATGIMTGSKHVTYVYALDEVEILPELPPEGEGPGEPVKPSEPIVPVEPTEPDDGGVEIVPDDVPLGELPNTGLAVQPVDPVTTLGLLALTLSLAAAGIGVIGRKKEEDAE